jgi:hypothetical protein
VKPASLAPADGVACRRNAKDDGWQPHPYTYSAVHGKGRLRNAGDQPCWTDAEQVSEAPMAYPNPKRYLGRTPKLCDRHGCRRSRYPAMRYCCEHAAELRGHGFDPSVYAVNGVPRERAQSLTAPARGSAAASSACGIGKSGGGARHLNSAHARSGGGRDSGERPKRQSEPRGVLHPEHRTLQ